MRTLIESDLPCDLCGIQPSVEIITFMGARQLCRACAELDVKKAYSFAPSDRYGRIRPIYVSDESFDRARRLI